MLLLSLCALPLLPTLPRATSATATPQHGVVPTASQAQGTRVAAGGRVSTPAPDLGVANYTANWFNNPDLELWDHPYDAAGSWYESASADSFTWYAQTPYPVQEGSYSAGLQCRSQTYGQSLNTYWYQSGYTMAANDVNVTFYWYLDQNPDPGLNHDYFMFDIRIYSSGVMHYLYYYLNGTTSGSNSSSYAHFRLGGPSQQWNRFSRNISADYDAMVVAQGWSTLASNAYCHYPHFEVRTIGYTTQYTRAFFDDFWVKNTTYTLIGGTTHNGNLESTTSWTRRNGNEAGFVRQSITAHTGSYSANLTVSSTGNNSYANFGATVYPRASAQNQMNLSFWWYLDYQGPAYPSNWYVFYYMYVYNGTDAERHGFNVRYYLGDGYVGSPIANDSTGVVYNAAGHNTTGSWVYFNRNIWADLTARFNLKEAWCYDSYFLLETYVPSTITLLVDTTRLEAAAVNGGDHEDQLNVGDKIHGWSYPYNDGSPYVRVTDTSYSGGKALNLTLTGGASYYGDQFIERPINGSRETYLDLAWYLDDYTDSVASCYAYLQLRLRNVTNGANYYMLYGMAIQDSTWGSNSSSYVYFNVTGVNTLDTWYLMHRDLAHDFESWFGFIPNVEIYRVSLIADTDPGGKVSLLLDDFYIYDDPAPEVSYVVRDDPIDHNDPCTVTAIVNDQDVDTVLLHYRVDGGGWETPIVMTDTASYEGDIPGQVYDSFVEYYVTANDTWGMTAINDNDGSYYSYTVTDLTAPLLSGVTTLPVAPMYLDLVRINVSAVDDESGIDYVNLHYRIGGGSWETPILMTPAAGDLYEGEIVGQPWNTLVEYYFEGFNNDGDSAVLDNSGAYYSYTTGDITVPAVTIHAPSNGATLSGTVSVNVNATDGDGSGIAYIEVYLGSTLLHNSTSATFVYSWDTTTVLDGEHQVRATAYDNAGNSQSYTITVTTINQLLAAQQIQTTALIVAAIVIIVVIVILLLWFLRFRKPK